MKRARLILALLLVGIFIGSSLVNFLVSHEIDRLHVKISELNKQINDKEQKLNKFEKELATAKKKYVIQDIGIELTSATENTLDSSVKLELMQEIEKILSELLWKEVKTINPFLIYKIIDGRIIETKEQNKFVLEAKVILVSEKLLAYIVVTEKEEKISNIL